MCEFSGQAEPSIAELSRRARFSPFRGINCRDCGQASDSQRARDVVEGVDGRPSSALTEEVRDSRGGEGRAIRKSLVDTVSTVQVIYKYIVVFVPGWGRVLLCESLKLSRGASRCVWADTCMVDALVRQHTRVKKRGGEFAEARGARGGRRGRRWDLKRC
jgi:hypothetical protein